MKGKFCKKFKKAHDEYLQEIEEHNIHERYKKNPKKYQDDIDAIEGIQTAYKRICVEKKRLNKRETKGLRLVGDVMERELYKWDVLVPKKREIEYRKLIETIRIAEALYGENDFSQKRKIPSGTYLLHPNGKILKKQSKIGKLNKVSFDGYSMNFESLWNNDFSLEVKKRMLKLMAEEGYITPAESNKYWNSEWKDLPKKLQDLIINAELQDHTKK